VAVPLSKSGVKAERVCVGREVAGLADALGVSFDEESVRRVVGLGLKSAGKEAELLEAVERLEAEKLRFAGEFRELASRRSQLETLRVGVRNRFAGVSRDNRALAMHLSARTVKGVRKERLRSELIQKYILNYKDT